MILFFIHLLNSHKVYAFRKKISVTVREVNKSKEMTLRERKRERKREREREGKLIKLWLIYEFIYQNCITNK